MLRLEGHNEVLWAEGHDEVLQLEGHNEVLWAEGHDEVLLPPPPHRCHHISQSTI